MLYTSLVALAYYAAAHLSLNFTSMEGKLASIWLPSALTLVLVLHHGYRVFPGIIIGSFLGPYGWLEMSMGHWILFNSVCAIANCIQPSLVRQFLHRQGLVHQAPQHLFLTTRGVVVYGVAAIASPMVSACLGITALGITDQLPWSRYGAAWLVWWLASALAHLIFVPPFLLWPNYHPSDLRGKPWEAGAIAVAITVTIWLIFVKSYPLTYLLLPLLMWIVVRWGLFLTSLGLTILAIIAIVTTALNQGLFARYEPYESFILVQVFIGSFSLICLFLSAIIQERDQAQKNLHSVLLNLEETVSDRTLALQSSQAQLNSFFATAALGMGILDHNLRCVRINPTLAQIMGLNPGDSITGQSLQDLLPCLSTAIAPLLPQILESGKTIKEQEIILTDATQPQGKTVYLASYFPIIEPPPSPVAIGLVLRDITPRKILEEQLAQAALMDGLTHIANRRHFDQVLGQTWYNCWRDHQPLTLFLCDVDYFKPYNDTYGHPQGDRCLITLAATLALALEGYPGLVARYGGEEFAVILPHLEPAVAEQWGQALLDRIHQIHLPHSASAVRETVTLSLGGVNCVPRHSHGVPGLVAQADRLLYEAKTQGRDRLVFQDWSQGLGMEL
ncbi:hypothetical protein PROH_04915 [Prochlorothrix hollandica PCC 9006 = CALU 1027]|uniref:GGDEF domain-containing protein n=1 Tax=Prochlorothrix hollandica PCC 9006 = CALU 1027 TaxID=317619 RepID=A0A0M2Q0M0_PROHO|nr:hypothetical protein PROH_04915 [Prochlorothrix hollandica PCC 9006 = CALU 1027]